MLNETHLGTRAAIVWHVHMCAAVILIEHTLQCCWVRRSPVWAPFVFEFNVLRTALGPSDLQFLVMRYKNAVHNFYRGTEIVIIIIASDIPDKFSGQWSGMHVPGSS